MLDYAREAVAMFAGKGRGDLDSNRMLFLALVRLVEIVGEAAAHVSVEFQQSRPAIPWPQIVSLRNRLIHGYDAVDLDILWRILNEDFPPMIAELEKLPLPELPK